MLDRCPWYHPGPTLAGERLRLHRAAFDEPMPPGLVDRPQGTDDVLLMVFHHPVIIDHDSYPAMTLRCWPHGAGHRYGSTAGIWHHSWVHCDGLLAEAMAAALPAARTLTDSEAPLRHLRHLVRCCVLDRDGLLAEGALRGLVRCLQLQHRDPDPIPPAWRDLRRWLETHAHEPQSLDALAGRMGLAHSRFSQLFTAYFGLPPLRFIQHQRLERARWLLQDRNRNIATVAREVGYEDVGYFGRLMRRHYGRSPGQLRDP